jgi:hypothetical protein
MAFDRTTLIRGPGYGTLGSSTTPSTTTNLIQSSNDAKVIFDAVNDDLMVSTQGKVDETRRDRKVRLSLTPKAYTPTQATLLAWMFAQCNQLPVIGASLCGGTDTPFLYLGSNGDQLVLFNACVPKPPHLNLDINKDLLGPLEIVGLIRNNFDPETANSIFSWTTGISYAAPVLLQTGVVIGRQRYGMYWAAGNTAAGNSHFGSAFSASAFQGKEGITIDFQADWQEETVQGLTVDYKLGEKGLHAMARLIPAGPTATDIIACQQFQGTGSKHGSRLTANTAMGDAIFYGQIGGTFTIKNAVLKTAGFVFGGKPLRTGEIGLMGTFNLTGTPSTGGVLLA